MSKLNVANSNGSTSIIIPKSLLKILNWGYGEDVYIHLNKDKNKIIIEKLEND